MNYNKLTVLLRFFNKGQNVGIQGRILLCLWNLKRWSSESYIIMGDFCPKMPHKARKLSIYNYLWTSSPRKIWKWLKSTGFIPWEGWLFINNLHNACFLSLFGRFWSCIHTRMVIFDSEPFRIYTFKASYRPFLKNLRITKFAVVHRT